MDNNRHQSGSSHGLEAHQDSKRNRSKRHEHRPKNSRSDDPGKDRAHRHKSDGYRPKISSKAGPAALGESFSSDYFVSDRKGDPGILQYGSNHSYQIPQYRRIGYGLVLGLSRLWKIDRQQSTAKQIYLVHTALQTSKRDKAVFGKVAGFEEYRIRPTSFNSDDDDLYKSYLSFKSRETNARHGSEEDSNDNTDNDSIDYRSIEGKAKATYLIDKDLELNQSTLEHNLHDNSTILASLARAVEVEPANGQAWLDLINQKYGSSTGHRTYAERMSVADIKISMYEKALKNVTEPLKERLLLELLKEAPLVWDQNKVQKKWRDTIHTNAHSFKVWKEYLNYVQTNPMRFKFDDLKEAYKECFDVFKDAMNDKRSALERHGSQSVQQERGKIATQLIYLLLRFSICLREAGYIETAIAIWQVNLERQFSDSPNSNGITNEKIESFWESEVPRIGESNALGLYQYQDYGGNICSEIEDPSRPDSSTLDVSKWLVYEAKMSTLLPARTTDITDEEDPFRVVLFSDVQPFIIELPVEASEILLDALLLFCGLPLLWQQESRDWPDDPFIHHGNWEDSLEAGYLEIDNGHQGRGLDAASNSSCRISTDILFGRVSPFPCSQQKTMNTESDEVLNIDKLLVSIDWIHNVLKTLIHRRGTIDLFKLMEYYLAFELQYYSSQVRKSSKSLLKTYPQSLLLYNTHSLIEYRLGNSAQAESVLQTTLNMRPEDPAIILLKRTMVWESLESNETSKALEYLLQDFKTHGEAAIFQVQQNLLSGRDKAIVGNAKGHLVPLYIDCLILLSYLTNPNPLDAALAIFESNLLFISTKLTQRNECVEILHQNLTRLLQYHMAHYQYKPSLIRRAIQRSLAAFPTNTLFLSLFQSNEQRFRINDRVRSVISVILSGQQSSSLVKSSPLIGHLFAIKMELSRMGILGSSKESIRGAFQRALEDPETKSSPLVWSLYFKFEFEFSRSGAMPGVEHKAQNIISRSLGACPWVLNLHLLAIKTQIGAEKSIESRGVYEMIEDRELRLHVSLKQRVWP